jgi:hypothetical protein
MTSSTARTIEGMACAGCTIGIYRATWLGESARGGTLLSTVTAAGYDWTATLPTGLTYRDVTLVATDPAGNSSEMSPRTPPLTIKTISPGGRQEFLDEEVTITFPRNAVSEDVTITYAGIAAPPQPYAGDNVLSFNLEARTSSGEPVTEFDRPYRLVLHYTDAQLAALGIEEKSLNVAFWDGTSWVNMLPCAECGINTVQNTVTIVADHFTEFTMKGPAKVFIPLSSR